MALTMTYTRAAPCDVVIPPLVVVTGVAAAALHLLLLLFPAVLISVLLLLLLAAAAALLCFPFLVCLFVFCCPITKIVIVELCVFVLLCVL